MSWVDELIDKLQSMRFAKMVQQVLDWMATITQSNAKVNAPVLTWALRSSLDVQFSSLSYAQSIVGSKLPYAWIREVNNDKHPNTKYYLKRWYTEHISEINSLVQRSIRQWL